MPCVFDLNPIKYGFTMIMVFTVFLMPYVLHVGAEDLNLTQNYNPAELLSKIFRLEQNETLQRNINGNYALLNKASSDSQDIFQDESEDVSRDVAFRNEFKRRKRRRPLVQRFPNQNGFSANPYQYPYPGNGGHFYERPSFASEALSRVTEALTSIAVYDDYQCVPRLLCEAAGGGALGSSSLLQSVTGLQPLLTLLSAYSGISSNPLFVFGRAALLGMSSKENPGSCRYAYPLCPTDPEQLVHYLNNHNGGFFRFFNTPQKEQQNIEQFYNHLQGYGFQQNQQNFGPQQNYGLYQQQQQNGPHNVPYPVQQQNSLQNIQDQQNVFGYGLQRPNPYLEHQQNYGFAYPYNNRVKYNKFNNKIEKRIQNNPLRNDNDFVPNHFNSKWIFPDTNNVLSEYSDIFDGNRKGKGLKFPESNTKYILEESHENTGFIFPNSNSDSYSNHIDYNYLNNFNTDSHLSVQNNYKLESQNEFIDKTDNRFVTVYVVRGNGDPNKPEIVKLRPGQSL